MLIDKWNVSGGDKQLLFPKDGLGTGCASSVNLILYCLEVSIGVYILFMDKWLLVTINFLFHPENVLLLQVTIGDK